MLLKSLLDFAVTMRLLRCRHTWHSLEYIFGFLLMTTWVNPVLLILSLAANEQTLPGGAGAPYSSSSSSSGKQDLAPDPFLSCISCWMKEVGRRSRCLLQMPSVDGPRAALALSCCRAAEEEGEPGARHQPCGVAQAEEGRHPASHRHARSASQAQAAHSLMLILPEASEEELAVEVTRQAVPCNTLAR